MKKKNQIFDLPLGEMKISVWLMLDNGRLALPSEESEDELMKMEGVDSVNVSMAGYFVLFSLQEDEFTADRMKKIRSDISEILNKYGFEAGA